MGVWRGSISQTDEQLDEEYPDHGRCRQCGILPETYGLHQGF